MDSSWLRPIARRWLLGLMVLALMAAMGYFVGQREW